MYCLTKHVGPTRGLLGNIREAALTSGPCRRADNWRSWEQGSWEGGHSPGNEQWGMEGLSGQAGRQESVTMGPRRGWEATTVTRGDSPALQTPTLEAVGLWFVL